MKIAGDRIVLRPMKESDIPDKVRWFNDTEVNKTLLLEENLDVEKTRKWFAAAESDDTRRDFAIETEDGRAIGITGLVNINRKHGTAECFCVIGDRDFWGKGFGTEVHSVLIQWAFEKLGLFKIWADIKAENAAIIKVIGKLGFKTEGVLRKEKNINGQRIDVVRIGLLRDEFQKTHSKFVVTI